MANLIDNAIQQLFKDGCKIVKLWENASPTSSFEPQDILVPCGEYDGIVISYKSSNASQTYEFISGCRYKEDTMLPGEIATSIDSGGQSAQFNFRNNVLQANKIIFYGAWYKTVESGANTVNNNALIIPIIIYGIKLLGGVIHKIKSLAASLFRKEVLVCQF